jgi:Family of unknown function (DUF6188)
MTTANSGEVPSSDLFGGQELPASGEAITAITLDSNIVICAGAQRDHEFRIENDVRLRYERTNSVVVVRYQPYRHEGPIRENLTELASILPETIRHARAYMTGRLELVLTGELFLSVDLFPPAKPFEPWNYTHGDFSLSCPPGGFQ